MKAPAHRHALTTRDWIKGILTLAKKLHQLLGTVPLDVAKFVIIMQK